MYKISSVHDSSGPTEKLYLFLSYDVANPVIICPASILVNNAHPNLFSSLLNNSMLSAKNSRESYIVMQRQAAIHQLNEVQEISVFFILILLFSICFYCYLT